MELDVHEPDLIQVALMTSVTLMWILLAALLPSFLLTFVSAFWIRRRAASWGLIDKPGLGVEVDMEKLARYQQLYEQVGQFLPYAAGN